jgi:hypothetical protein
VRSQLTSQSLESLLLDSFFSSPEKSSLILFFFAVERGSGEEPTHLPVPGIPAAGLCFLSGLEKNGVHEYNFCNKKFNPLDLS